MRGAGYLRQAEVQHLHRVTRAFRLELDVRRFQIAMNDTLVVRGFERVRDLARDCQRLIEWQRTFVDRSASVGLSTSSITR